MDKNVLAIDEAIKKANKILISGGTEHCGVKFKVQQFKSEGNSFLIGIQIVGGECSERHSYISHGPIQIQLTITDGSVYIPTMQVGDFTTGDRCDCIGGIKLGYFLLYIAALVAEKLEIERIELDDCTGKPGYYFGAAFSCEDEECSPEELVGMACNVKECTREKLEALSCQGKACSFQFDIEELK